MIRDLPALLTQLQACTLSAEAHHVAASILLKTGDHGLGWLAADRSMQAARASHDAATTASSARIITLLSSQAGLMCTRMVIPQSA